MNIQRFHFIRYCIKGKCQKRTKDDDSDESDESVFETVLVPQAPPVVMGPCGFPQRRFEYQSEHVVCVSHYKYYRAAFAYLCHLHCFLFISLVPTFSIYSLHKKAFRNINGNLISSM